MSKVTLAALLVASLSLSACVTSRYEIHYTKPCSTVVPDDNKKAVPGAPLPTIGDGENLLKFGADQTGQLDKANKLNRDNLQIVTKCEEHDRSAVIVAKQKVIGIAIKKK